MRSIALLAGQACLAGAALVLPALVIAALPSAPASAQTVEELREMSIEDLAQVNVTSVSKTDQPLADAPAAVYVITRDDILRSGAATFTEMARRTPKDSRSCASRFTMASLAECVEEILARMAVAEPGA